MVEQKPQPETGPAAAGLRPDPRYNQRMRTRQAVLSAARELVQGGLTPTVPEAADAALVSRATAYRYFPTQAALLVEASMMAGLPTADSLFGGPGAPTDVADRVALVSDVMFRHISSVEREFRLLLREQLVRSLNTEKTSAPGAGLAVRLPLIDAALEPIAASMEPRTLERLRNALAVLIGTEAVVACRDVLRLDSETARSGMGWACRALVHGALAESAALKKPSPKARHAVAARTIAS